MGPVPRPAMSALVALLLLFPQVGITGPNCVPSELQKILDAAGEVDPDVRQELVAYGLVDACELPDALRGLLSGLAQVPPDMRSMLVYKAIADDLSLLGECKKPIEMVIAVGESAREKHLKLIRGSCDLDGLGSDEELAAVDASSLLLAVIVRDWLRKQKMDLADALGRHAGGLDQSPGEGEALSVPPLQPSIFVE